MSTPSTRISEGKLLRLERDTDADGVPEDVTIYEYEDGKLTREVLYVNEQGGLVLAHNTRYSYDARDRLVRILRGPDAKPRSVTVYVRNQHHIIQTHQDLYCDGVVELSTYYDYDDLGRMISLADYASGDEEPYKCIEYRYDRHGWLVEMTTYRNGGLHSASTLAYDPAGRLIETRSSNPLANSVASYTNDCPL